MLKNNFIFWGAILGSFAVAIGAFGAHALQDWLISIRQVETFQTASKYHFYHTFFIILIGILLHLNTGNFAKRRKALVWAAKLHLLGTLIFSGTLYLLCLTNIRWLGAITPIGGTLLIIGWVLFAISALGKE